MDAVFDTTAFQNRLRKVWRHISRTARKQNIACFRFYDHDLPEFPFAIDWYDGAVHLAEYLRRHGMEEEEHEAWLQACVTALTEVLIVDRNLVFLKRRQRKAGRQGQYQKFGEETIERIVPERDLNFILNLTDYLDTGLFLDHRLTRSMVREASEGKKVLNLFCYTGSFSVYAAKGAAAHVTSVDLSNTYLHWTKRNLQYNKLYKPEKHDLIQGDVLQWMRGAPAAAYDLIICDPPTFSNSKRMETEFDVQRDHVELLRHLIRLLRPEGQLYFSNNYTRFQLEEAAFPDVTIKDITPATTPFDFAGKLKRVCFLITKPATPAPDNS